MSATATRVRRTLLIVLLSYDSRTVPLERHPGATAEPAEHRHSAIWAYSTSLVAAGWIPDGPITLNA
ncbi:hypothetical protein [Streptomyces microflavus]|uniref:hypothetical protein n=1 Tax=Streptomyces microflavus TaxID=1919 RepID=UPI0036A0E8AA